jgi:hypothetical protein
MISRTKEFVKISNIIGPPQIPRVKGLPGLATVQACGDELIKPLAQFFVRFPYPARRCVIVRSEIPRPAGRPYAKNLFGGHFKTVSDADPTNEIASGLRSRKDRPAVSVPKMRPHGKRLLILTMLYVNGESTRKRYTIIWGNV